MAFDPDAAFWKFRSVSVVSGRRDHLEIKFGLISSDSHGQLDKDAYTSRMSKSKWGDRIPHVVEVRDEKFTIPGRTLGGQRRDPGRQRLQLPDGDGRSAATIRNVGRKCRGKFTIRRSVSRRWTATGSMPKCCFPTVPAELSFTTTWNSSSLACGPTTMRSRNFAG